MPLYNCKEYLHFETGVIQMKFIIAIALIIPLNLWAADNNLHLADIGFNNSDEYIGIGIEFGSGSEIEYGFSLCKTSNGSCLKFNDCKYKETSLIKNLSESKNEKFKNEFDWIFLRSGKSILEINEFYPEFSDLLKRTLPNCIVPKLSSENKPA